MAIAAAEQGNLPEAATLAGSAAATRSESSPLQTPRDAWVLGSLDAALSALPERETAENTGALASRGQIMALVSLLDGLNE